MTDRRLAAILVADVVAYSKLIGSDEAGTLAQLGTLCTGIIEPQLAKHAGRLFKSVGDGFLVEFASAVQAVTFLIWRARSALGLVAVGMRACLLFHRKPTAPNSNSPAA